MTILAGQHNSARRKPPTAAHTVPYKGCVVQFNGSYDLPYEYDELPLGEHEVDEEWDDTECTLVLAPEDAAKHGRAVAAQS